MSNAKKSPANSASSAASSAASSSAAAAISASEAASSAAQAGTEALSNFFKVSQAGFEAIRSAAEKSYQQIASVSQEQSEQATKTAFKVYEELNASARDSADTISQTSTSLAKAFEDVGKALVGFAQQSIESNVSATKAIVGAKNPKEALDVQADWAKSSLDSFLVESNRLSDMSIKLANEAIEPIQERANETVTRIFKVVQ